jgi:hypothetical protein
MHSESTATSPPIHPATATSPVAGLSLGHYEHLVVASGISDRVAQRREYRTLTTLAEATALGFNAEQAAHLPALLVPLWDSRGRPAGYVLRPDRPRKMPDGKDAKYEHRPGAAPVLDVARGSHQALHDPVNALLITEGARKLDSFTSAVEAHLGRGGGPVVGISLGGVAAWRGANEHGARSVPLPEWREIPMRGAEGQPRRVYLCFDSDVMEKPAVHRALEELRAYLLGLGADVRIVYLPPGEGGAKTGLDDFLVSGHTVQDVLNLGARDLRPLGAGFLSVEDLWSLPDVPWLVGPLPGDAGDGLLPQEGVSGLFGKPGTGKSLIALDLAAHVALGKSWCGRPVRRGPVVYLAAEGKAGLPQRLRAWCAHHEVDRAALADLHFLPAAEDLADPAVAASLAARIRERCGRPALIIVDTLAKAMPGRDENSVEEVGQLLASCDRLRAEFGCNVLTVHHPNKAGGVRGSTAYEGGLDTLVLAERQGEGSDLTLRVVKQRDAAEAVVGLALKPVARSMVVVTGRPVPRQTSIGPKAYALLERLKEDEAIGRSAWYAGFGAGERKSLDRARAELVEKGLAIPEEGKRGWYRLTPAGARFLMEHRRAFHPVDGNPAF